VRSEGSASGITADRDYPKLRLLIMLAVRRTLAGRALHTSARRLASSPSGSENPIATETQKKEITAAVPSQHVVSAEAVSGAPGRLTSERNSRPRR
jgi:hypothetical protein